MYFSICVVRGLNFADFPPQMAEVFCIASQNLGTETGCQAKGPLSHTIVTSKQILAKGLFFIDGFPFGNNAEMYLLHIIFLVIYLAGWRKSLASRNFLKRMESHLSLDKQRVKPETVASYQALDCL